MSEIFSKGLWMVMAAGTGGHIIPALAIAKGLQQQGYTVRWLGTKEGLEQRLVKEAGITIDTIPMAGIRGKGLARWLKAPWIILSAVWAAICIFKKHRPVAVLGMGGFVTAPGGLAAALLGIPLVIHEQNAIPGLSNRLLKPFARTVMTAFPNTFAPHLKIQETGNPIRTDILALALPRQVSQPLKLLVMGGSLGAHAINDVLLQLCQEYPNLPLEIWHQTGAKDFDRMQLAYQQAAISLKVVPFIEDVASAYEWADLVLCRAGAMTVFELAAAGRASILIPYPHAVDDHQTANARYLADQEAAIMIPSVQLTDEALAKVLTHLMSCPAKIIQMSERARALAQPNATKIMVDLCLKACS